MKLWKVVSLILSALAVAAAGYGLILMRRGFSALATPSAIEEFAATTARKLAVPSAYRTLIYYNQVDKGGHYAAWEQPQLFSEEFRAGFRSLR
jgi:hypothetical protein